MFRPVRPPWQGLLLLAFLSTWLPPRAGAAQASPLVPSGATTRPAATVAAMLALEDLKPGTYVLVEGYRKAGDQGGGVFRYDESSNAPEDAGSVFALPKTPGRLLRVVEPEGDAFAEWFGAYGDGQHADEGAINACLAAYGRVRLLAKTYGVRGRPEPHDAKLSFHAIDLAPGWRIEGTHRARTRIRLLEQTNAPASEPANNVFRVLANRAFHESADNLIVRDLTIDGNFDGQTRARTVSCLHIRGGNALVERVNLRGYGTGRHPTTGSSRECFVIYQTLVYKDAKSSRRAATLRDLDFTDPGHNGDLPGPVSEITHIALGGANNFENQGWILKGARDPAWDPADRGENDNNWWPSHGGLVEGCVIHDVARDARQRSPLNGITYADCVGLVVRSNRIERFEGTALFVMSWWNKATTIVENQFLDVENGFALQVKGDQGRAMQAPRHEDLLVERNLVRTGRPMHTEWGTRGFQMYGQEVGSGVRFKNVVIRDNTFSGRAFTDSKDRRIAPQGIVFQVRGANYDGIQFDHNVVDMPDHVPGGFVPDVSGSLSMTFFPMARWADDVKSGRVEYRGNRTPAGKPLSPLLADWDFKNRPHWGRGQRAVPVTGQ